MFDRTKQVALSATTTAFATAMLGAMGAAFAAIPRIRRQLMGQDGDRYRARIVFKTFDGSASASAVFTAGLMTARPWAVGNPDVVISFLDEATMRDQLSPRPRKDIFAALLDGDVVYEGNLSHLARFSYLTTEINRPRPRKPQTPLARPSGNGKGRLGREAKPMKPHAGVRFLKDPAFADKELEDWPRLKALWEKHFTTKPAICGERARLITDFFRVHGFETTAEGESWNPALRQGRVLEHLLKHKEARVEDDDLLLGTTTTNRVGVPVFPEFGGIAIWPELRSVSGRELNPYDIDDETRRVLNEEVFPFWIDRNVREYNRRVQGNPECQRLEERWVLYFMWKVHAISHTIPDFPSLLRRGLLDIRDEAKKRAEECEDERRPGFHQGVVHALDGVLDYARRMAEEAERVAATLDPKRDAERISELTAMAARVRHAPAHRPRTFAEAVSAIWIVWLCLHQENMNAGLSIGRLDPWLQPFLAADLKKAGGAKQRERIIEDAIELMGAFFLKCQDHLPLVPDIGNRLFGGSSSDQVITLGGVDEKGESAVCDMTYILLKVTEILGLRDPNVNARYHREKNPKAYLRRLVEVNAITCATPSMHNDASVIAALREQGFAPEHARDWSATGCVEPTSCGRHMGHTNCMMFNLVAPLEMALNDGVHPLLGERIGEATGDLRNGGAPPTFEAFLEAYKRHLKRMIDHSIDYNNQLGRAHQALHPTPLLSALIQGTAESGRDVTSGGAVYNSSGVALVALVDVVDSLMAVRKLVYEDKAVTWKEMMAALDDDFAGHEKLHARIRTRVPRFGSGAPEPEALARDLIDFCYDAFQSRENYRGGRYTTGFWSMSNHVAFGVLSGALPSGRRRGKAFTPGLTPTPEASKTILDPIRTLGALDPLKLPNNIAFNVKLFPAPGESMERFVDTAANLTAAYMDLGGMQMQFNIVTGKTLKDAMADPAAYRNLLVRISGYNAYFVELNRDCQIELIERAEFQA